VSEKPLQVIAETWTAAANRSSFSSMWVLLLPQVAASNLLLAILMIQASKLGISLSAEEGPPQQLEILWNTTMVFEITSFWHPLGDLALYCHPSANVE
jgi:hypothetical protein